MQEAVVKIFWMANHIHTVDRAKTIESHKRVTGVTQ